jgi:cytochrome P450
MHQKKPYEFDPFLSEFHDDPYPRYEHLREHCPVFYSDRHDMWFVARHADVMRIFRDAHSFSNETRMSAGFLPMIATMDPPRHDALRAVLTGNFMPNRLGRLSAFVREIARQLLERIDIRNGCDLIADFATEIPTRVTCHLLGVPETMRGTFCRLTEEIFPTFESAQGLQPSTATPIYALAEELLDLKRRTPGEDISTQIAFATIEGQSLTRKEMLAYILQLIVAGFETTRGLIGNTAWLLSSYPEQRERLRAFPDLIPRAIEESLRHESPTPMIFRTTREPVEIQGVRIPESAIVVPIMASANRDASVFEAPDRFDIERKSLQPHLAFGAGIHFCLGNHLARLEATICLEEMLRILPAWKVVEAETRRHGNPIARGFLSLPLRFEASRPAVHAGR